MSACYPRRLIRLLHRATTARLMFMSRMPPRDLYDAPSRSLLSSPRLKWQWLFSSFYAGDGTDSSAAPNARCAWFGGGVSRRGVGPFPSIPFGAFPVSRVPSQSVVRFRVIQYRSHTSDRESSAFRCASPRHSSAPHSGGVSATIYQLITELDGLFDSPSSAEVAIGAR